MKKKTTNKMNKTTLILMVASFFVGLVIAILFMSILPRGKNVYYEKASLAEVVEEVKDAVVSIETYSGTALTSNGSGFIYKKGPLKAYILTNAHVIDGNEIKIYTSKDKEVQGKLLGKDAYLDLAVIEISAKDAPKAITLGDSNTIRPGDTVFTIGSPIGKSYQGSVSAGVLSGKDRIVHTTLEGNNSEWLMNVLQFDASTNPGNSGGPLLNAKGEVVGICSLKLIQDGIEGMSFAIPIEYAIQNMDSLEKGKTIEWPELGVGMTNVDNTAQLLNEGIEVPKDVLKGAVILSVKENGSADNSLKRGDIITKIDDIEIKDTSYVKYAIFKHKVGDKVKIKLLRNNKEKTVKRKRIKVVKTTFIFGKRGISV